MRQRPMRTDAIIIVAGAIAPGIVIGRSTASDTAASVYATPIRNGTIRWRKRRVLRNYNTAGRGVENLTGSHVRTIGQGNRCR